MADVVADVRDAVALITFNRPEALNAWTPELRRSYFDHLLAADDDPDVRAIVVTGAGRGFCAGEDMSTLESIGRGDAYVEPDPRPQSFPRSLRKPVIAAVNGPCAGLGLVAAVMCDVRFAAEDVKFTTAFVRRGLVAEYGFSWVLSRLVGTGRALDLLLSGRIVLGDEAYRIGLVEHLCAPGRVLEEALEYARDLVTHASPASMHAIKRQVYDDLESSFDRAREAADAFMRESFGRPDLREGAASFVERRPPRFPSLPRRG